MPVQILLEELRLVMKEGFAPLQELFSGGNHIMSCHKSKELIVSLILNFQFDKFLTNQIIFLREEGVLRTAMSRHCVSRTPDRT